jgi:hypothetical protein
MFDSASMRLVDGHWFDRQRARRAHCNSEQTLHAGWLRYLEVASGLRSGCDGGVDPSTIAPLGSPNDIIAAWDVWSSNGTQSAAGILAGRFAMGAQR